ncbi:MAG: hypothetical protein Q7T14_06035 [Aestuariivirga sp.]|nr:hypothetical protein [Aestuariivirga sp.]
MPFMRSGSERAARDVGCFTRGCERKAFRNRADRCKRGAIGKELSGLGVIESTAIVLNNLSYPHSRPHEKIKASIAAHLRPLFVDPF